MSAFVVPYNKQMFVEMVRNFLSDGAAGDAFSMSDEEITLHIDWSISDKIPKLAYTNAGIEGVLSVAEGFLITYKFVVSQQDSDTGFWFITLPQPPLSLPLGYSINDAYFTDPRFGKSRSIFLIKAKRIAFRNELPDPPGVRGWVENSTFWMKSPEGGTLLNANLRIQMPVGRTADMSTPFNLPDDILTICFDEVIQRLTRRFAIPRNNIADGEPAGNNKVKDQ